MSRAFEDFKNPQRRLPDISLRSAEPRPEPVRPSARRSRLLVMLHGQDCEDCRGFVQRLAEREQEIADWDGEVRLVVPHALREEEEGLGAEFNPYSILEDPELRLSTGLGVDHPAIVLVDQWGIIRHLEPAGAEHAFLAPGELVEWLRFLAIECPECQGEAY